MLGRVEGLAWAGLVLGCAGWAGAAGWLAAGAGPGVGGCWRGGGGGCRLRAGGWGSPETEIGLFEMAMLCPHRKYELSNG